MLFILCDLCVLCGQFIFGCRSPRFSGGLNSPFIKVTIKKQLHVPGVLPILLPVKSFTINNVTDVSPFPDLSINRADFLARNLNRLRLSVSPPTRPPEPCGGWVVQIFYPEQRFGHWNATVQKRQKKASNCQRKFGQIPVSGVSVH